MKKGLATQRCVDMLQTAFGPTIIGLLDNDDIIEIMANSDGKLWAEALDKGKYFTGICLSPTQIGNIIKLVAAYKQATTDSNNPEVSCELPNTGARFQGWLPPVVFSPNFTIRKRATRIFNLKDYVDAKALTKKHFKLLSDAIKQKRNILIAGGTASGKTTFANALLNELKETKDRIIILEDLPELQLNVEDYVALRTTPNKTMRDLVKGVLRMRPDRIIIGEVRDGAALELLKAWNTGHPGGICTIHANSPQATLSRLSDLINEVVPVVPMRLLHEAINLIVFMQRDKNGHYIIDSVHEYVCENDQNYVLKRI